MTEMIKFRMGVLNSYDVWSCPPWMNTVKKVYLRTVKALRKKTIETCLKVNNENSIKLCFPQSLMDDRRTKSKVYEGFHMCIVMNSLMLHSKR
ncbi:hypothetical protein Hanom_Chr11g01025981 [Helianthus anomalus]